MVAKDKLSATYLTQTQNRQKALEKQATETPDSQQTGNRLVAHTNTMNLTPPPNLGTLKAEKTGPNSTPSSTLVPIQLPVSLPSPQLATGSSTGPSNPVLNLSQYSSTLSLPSPQGQNLPSAGPDLHTHQPNLPPIAASPAPVPRKRKRRAKPVENLNPEDAKRQELVKVLRETRTAREDFTNEMLVTSPSGGKVGFNCQRCYRLKKKCSKDFPCCNYCSKTRNDCFYVDRSKLRNNYTAQHGDKTNEEMELEKQEAIRIAQGDKAEPVLGTTVENMPGNSLVQGSEMVSADKHARPQLSQSSQNLQPQAKLPLPQPQYQRPLNLTNQMASNSLPPISQFHSEPVLSTLARKQATTDDSDSPIPQRIVTESNINTSEMSHTLISISTLLSEEKDPRQPRIAKPLRKYKKDLKSLDNQVLIKSVNEKGSGNSPSAINNFEDEFINLKSFKDNELPKMFIYNYFHNYENMYPILNKEEIISEIDKINFENESIINLKLYLVLSIGCLLNDSINQKQLFYHYFNDKIIEDIIHFTNFNQLTCNTVYEFNNLKALVLLTIYFLNKNNLDMTWNLMGILDRLMVKLDIFKNGSETLEIKQQIFWTVYNLDKELSLLLDKPSQLPFNEIVTIPEPETGEMAAKFIEYSKLEDKINNYKLRYGHQTNKDRSELNELSSEIETWRVSVSRIIHQVYSPIDSNYLQEFTLLINLNYYYLSIELDQLSHTTSSQFTLQFISQFFSLSILNNDQISNKNFIGLSLYSLFFIKKLFKVIKFNAMNLLAIVSEKDFESNKKVHGFMNNFQIVVNLLNYLNNNNHTLDLGGLIEAIVRVNGVKFDGSNSQNLQDSIKDIISQVA